MNKVKEEFFLSLIFLGKWLALGIGVFGVLYLSVNVTYNKVYYEPRMAGFDLRILEQREERAKVEVELATLAAEREPLISRISVLGDSEIPGIETSVSEAKAEIEKLGLKWWEKYEIPLISRNSEAEAAYGKLSQAESNLSAAIARRDELQDQVDSIDSSNRTYASQMDDIDQEITRIEQEKRRAQVEILSPVAWLGTLIGLN